MNFKIFISILLIIFFFTVSNTSAEIGMVVNQLSNRTSVPNYQLWNGSAWSASANATDVNGTIRWVVLKNNPLRYEKILGTLDSNNDVKVQFYNGTVWSDTTNMTLTASTSTYRAFDIAIEQQSGNVVVVYDNGTVGQLAYKIWNGTGWSNQQNVSTNGTGNSNWVRLEARPNSNEIILATLDTNSDIFARFWNGTSWGVATTLEGNAEVATKEDFDVAYEQSSGDAIVAWADATTANPRYRTYSNGVWSEELSATTSTDQNANYQWMRMKPYPNSDRIMLCTVDANSDLNCVQWSGSGWGTTNEIDASVEYNDGASFRNFDIAPETASGGFAIIYGDGNNDFYTFCRCNSNSNCNTGTFETCQTFLNSVDIGTDTSWGYLEFDPISAGNITVVMTDESSNTQWRAGIGCTASANSCILVENSASLGSSTNSIYESAMFSYTPIMPNLTSISASPNSIKGGNTITITADTVNDTNNNTLYFYCDSSNTPTSTNTDCKGGNTIDTSPPYDLTCTFTTAQTDQSNTIYCRVYDGYYYSQTKNTTYTTDSTQPTTSIVNVAGDTAPTYYDNVNDLWTNITISGEASMSCRWATSDSSYSSMTNNCIVSGTQALCSPITTTQGLDAYNFYVSCQDSVGNEQNSTNNLDVTALVTDWTVPTTSDNSSTAVATPNYAALIAESDNLFSAATITTYYCTDTVGYCTPTTSIDDGGTVTFTSSNRGKNFLRYYSIDPANNSQSTQNKTININQLPVFTSASDTATTIKGDSAVRITTVSSDADSGQTLKLYVCNSSSANYSGCSAGTYCSNNSATENPICDFTSEADSSTHTWHAFIYDELNESAATNTSGSYTTDSSPPNIVILDPSNTTYAQTSIPAAITLSEACSWAGYSLNGAANISMTNSTQTYWSATISATSNGVYAAVFYANDTLGNMNKTNIVFSVDTTLNDTIAPSITVWSPTNGTYYTSTTLLLNITLSENGNDASYSLNGTANASLGNVSMTNWNKTIDINEGLHNITFYANDTSSNRNTGNSSLIYFYIDATAPQNTTQGPATANDTTNITCYSRWTDNIELYYGYMEHNETGTAINSSLISLSGTSGWINYTIDSTNTTPSIIKCRSYAYDKAGLANSSTWFVNVTDVTAPALENISYLPNTTGDLDPNVMINVTANISDNVALSKKIIQYRLSNDSTWLEREMFSIGGTGYEGNFTPTSAANWTFRVYANDTSNNTNISSSREVNVSFDYTWVNTTTISTTKSIVQTESRNINLGNITVNNTGDYDLNYTVNSDKNWIKFNATSTSLAFRTNSTYNTTIFNVTANTTGFAVGSYTYTITINSYNLSSTAISSQTLSGTVVIQNVAGPYFVVTITSYDASVTQGDTGITLSAKIENVGTGDATNAWLAWSIPSDWSNTSGILNKSIGFLGVGSSATNSISVSISSSAATGSKTITASAGCSEDVAGSDSKTATVSSTSPTETTTQVVTTGGGGGVSTGVLVEKVLSKEEILSSSERVELVRGYSNSFLVGVKNIFDKTTLQNVSIKIEGFLSQYMAISPNVIDKIDFDKTKQFNVTMTSPEYMEKGEHALTIIITGKIVGVGISKDFTETRNVKFVIHSVSEKETNASIDEAALYLSEMAKAGFPTEKISKLLNQAMVSLSEHEYDNAKELSDQIKEIRETAFEANNLMQGIEGKIKSYGSINGILSRLSITGNFVAISGRFSETESILYLAKAAFAREDYKAALQRAKDAQMTFALEKGEFNFVFFLIDYWWAIILSALILSFSGFLGYQNFQKVTISQRIENLGREEDNIIKLIEEIQKRHFEEKTIGAPTFYKVMSQHQKRLSRIRQLRVKLRHKRTGLLKPREIIWDLEEERKELMNLLKNLQKDYFAKGKISKATYDEQAKVFNERLAEIEDEQLTLETKFYRGDKT